MYSNRTAALEKILFILWRWDNYQEQLERGGGRLNPILTMEVADHLWSDLLELRTVLEDLDHFLCQCILTETRFDEWFSSEALVEEDGLALRQVLNCQWVEVKDTW